MCAVWWWCGVQSWIQPSRCGGSEGTGVVSGRSDGSADTGVREMSAMGVVCACGVCMVCMVCAWERWEYERVCGVRVCGFCVCGRDMSLLACDATCGCVLCV